MAIALSFLGCRFRDDDSLAVRISSRGREPPVAYPFRVTTTEQPEGRIRVPADLDAVTTIGDEDHSRVDPAAVERIWQAARHWYAAGMHPAIQVCVRRHGRVVLNRAIGHGWGNGPEDPADAEKIPVTPDTPFCVYSAAKAITTTVVHLLAERGHFSLDDRVCEYLPNYTSHGKDRTTIRHVMTHSAGVPFPTGERPNLKRMNDSDYAREMLGHLRPLYRPGLVHIYHALTWGPLVREIVSAATGRGIRDILAEEILDPLGFRWTNFGVAESDVPRVAPSHATGKPLPPPIAAAFRTAVGGTLHQIIPFTNTPLFLTGVVPSSSTVSTAQELSRFAELLRRGGELDGVRVLRPETLYQATRECRRLRPDLATGLMPLRWGTGYMLGSRRFGPFGRDAPAAFGHTGLVDIAVWADPARGLAAGVVSSGKPGRHREANRYPALLDRINAELSPAGGEILG
jgi:CubicO group peptidase (beta-lactamase class C family)